jgi:hypothetical protein
MALWPVLIAKRSWFPTFGSAAFEDIIDSVPPAELELFIMLCPNAKVQIESATAARRIVFIVKLLFLAQIEHMNM